MKTGHRLLIGSFFVGASACSGETGHAPSWQRPHVSSADVILPEGADAEVATRRFVETEALQIPSEQLTLERSEVDALGMRHLRFQQAIRGIPVMGAELAAHYDARGRLAALDANWVSELDDVDVVPAIDVSASRAIARASLAAVPEPETTAERLVVFAPGSDRAPRLAYTHTLRVLGDEPALWIVTVDAKSGAILDRFDNLQTVEASAPGVIGNIEKFAVTAQGDGYVMTDASSGVEIRTLTATNQQVTPGSPITSASLTAWDRVAVGAGAAVDAHINASTVVAYYKDKHQRNSIDGSGGTLLSTVHFGNHYENAFWDGTGMTYGDGIERAYSVALDVVGHEMSHGVTERSSKLGYRGQSGALNEAISDIMGAFIEHSARPDDIKNWLIGEELSSAGKPVRNIANPNLQNDPAAMSQFVNTQQDNGGVHTNSCIISHAAFLMTVGGTNPATQIKVPLGIGWDKSEKLWYRANTTYFLASTNFAQAAQGVLQAAKDIGLSADEVAIVDCAWKAVGISQGACAAIAAPSSTPTSSPSSGGEGAPLEPPGAPARAADGSNGPTNTAGSSDSKRRRSVAAPQAGCSAAPGSSGGSPIALLLALAFVVATSRRLGKCCDRTRT